MAQQSYVLRRQIGMAFFYSHCECMRATTGYTRVPLANILTCDAACDECGEPLLQVAVPCCVHTDDRPQCGDRNCPCHCESVNQ